MATLRDLKKKAAKPATTTASPTAPAVDQLPIKRDMLAARRAELASGASSAVNVDAEIQNALMNAGSNTAIRNSSDESFYQAVRAAIASGLGLSAGYGFLTAKKGECAFVPGWKGLVDLVLRSERGTVWTGVVRKGDSFDYQLGDRPFVTHRPGDSDDPLAITYFYAIGRIKGSDTPIVEVWSASKLDRHFAKYNTEGEAHYALSSYEAWEAYGRKIPLLKVLSFMPKSRELDVALAADAATHNYTPVAGPDPRPTPAPEPAEEPAKPAAARKPAAKKAPARPAAKNAPAKLAAKKAAAKPAAKKAPAKRATKAAAPAPISNLE